MSSTVERIKEKLGIVEVVSGYVKLTKAGKNYKGLSPFTSEKTPSFFVSPDKNLYYCFSTNKGGDVFDFVQEMEGVDFKEALKILADKAGVPIEKYDSKDTSDRDRARGVLEAAAKFYLEKLHENKIANDYVAGRGISKDSIEKFNIGFAPDSWDSLCSHLKQKKMSDKDMLASGLFVEGSKGLYDRFRGRIMFPFFDYSGRIIGFTGRILPELEAKSEQGKYVNTPETILFHKGSAMYGISQAKEAIRKSGECVLVEGQIDVVLGSQSGVENIVAVSGTAFTEDHVTIIKRLAETLIVVLDSDRAGFKATGRTVRIALSSGLDVRVVKLPSGLDPADVAKKDPEAWKESIKGALDFSDYASKVIELRVKDKKERETLVRENLYPYIKMTENSLRRDESLQRVAKVLNVSSETAREDFSKWLAREEVGTAKPGEERTVVKKGIIEKEEFLSNRILAILLWQGETKEKIADLESLTSSFIESLGKRKTQIEKILKGNDLTDNEKKYRDTLVFRAESYYNDVDNLDVISKELKALILSLKRESVKENMESVMGRLRLAESNHDTKEIEQLLKEIEKLSKDLNK